MEPDFEGDYETVRDAIIEHLNPYDGDEAEPCIMAAAVEDAAKEIKRLRLALENAFQCARRITRQTETHSPSVEQAEHIMRFAREALPEDAFSLLR